MKVPSHRKNATISTIDFRPGTSQTLSTCDKSQGIRTKTEMAEWSSVFGKFLTSKDTRSAIQHKPTDSDVLLTETPLGFPQTIRKNDFSSYLQGTTTANQLVAKRNAYRKIPRQRSQPLMKEPGSQRTIKHFDKLKQLVGQRMDQRKQQGMEARAAEIRRMPFFKNFYYITQDYRQRILNKDLVSFNALKEQPEKSTSHLKQMTLIKKHDTEQSCQTVKQMKEEELQYFQHLTKTAIAETSQGYLQSLVLQDQLKEEKFRGIMSKHLNMRIVKDKSPKLMKSTIDKEYIQKLKRFKSYRADSVKLHVDDEDYKLFSYINGDVLSSNQNKSVEKTIGTFTRMLETNYATPHGSKSQKRPLVKRRPLKHHYESHINLTKESADESHNSSLHSAFEMRIDNLYTQSNNLQKKVLQDQEGFGKRVRQLLKLNQINQQIIGYNVGKLTG